ncbi:MAG: hypothetical protein ABI298_04440 [Acidimicrobiales bacterium]
MTVNSDNFIHLWMLRYREVVAKHGPTVGIRTMFLRAIKDCFVKGDQHQRSIVVAACGQSAA